MTRPDVASCWAGDQPLRLAAVTTLRLPAANAASLHLILHDHPILDAALRLGLAFVLVRPLGWWGEQRSRSAGPRTHALLSLCVCGFLLLAQGAAWGLSEQADVFYGVLNGIAFVASSAIMKSHETTRGLSTAVSLWVTGAIGAGVAFGSPQISLALSLMTALTRGPSLARRRRRP